MVIKVLTELYYQYQTAIVIMIGLTVVFISNKTISRKKKEFLFKMIFFDAVLMLCETFTHVILTPEVKLIPLRIITDIGGYLIRPMLILYFYLLVREERTRSFNYLLIIPLIIDFVVISSAFFTDIAFGYETTEKGTIFVRGPLCFVPFAVSACYLLILIIDSIKYFIKGKEKTSFAVVYSAFIVILGTVIETIDGQKRLIVNFAMLSTLIYFLLLYFKTIMEQEEEIVKNMRIEMMYSQIGPHFIFNTLSAIYGLVEKDPKKAKEAIEKFSGYLRGNIDSIGQTAPIKFVDELKHVDSYVWIEKMRFGDDLTVEYDIKTMDFSLPSLSLQPLVENAIKHGIHKKSGPGKVVINTREEDNAYIVEVVDDGVGFDTGKLKESEGFNIVNITDRGLGYSKRKARIMAEKNDTDTDEKAHVGIDNTKRRLSNMGLGRLDIVSEIGKGTKAVMTIYKEGFKDNVRSTR